jgi:hypothetical protein
MGIEQEYNRIQAKRHGGRGFTTEARRTRRRKGIATFEKLSHRRDAEAQRMQKSISSYFSASPRLCGEKTISIIFFSVFSVSPW